MGGGGGRGALPSMLGSGGALVNGGCGDGSGGLNAASSGEDVLRTDHPSLVLLLDMEKEMAALALPGTSIVGAGGGGGDIAVAGRAGSPCFVIALPTRGYENASELFRVRTLRWSLTLFAGATSCFVASASLISIVFGPGPAVPELLELEKRLGLDLLAAPLRPAGASVASGLPLIVEAELDDGTVEESEGPELDLRVKFDWSRG